MECRRYNTIMRSFGNFPRIRLSRIQLAVLLSLISVLSFAPQGRGQSMARDIYPAPEQAKTDLAAALRAAPAMHKRILLDFGGNWCSDCKVLDYYFHQAENLPILEKDFLMVHVNIGEYDRNVAIAERYGIPLKIGVPALAVLDEHGKLLYSQKQGEFESMRRVDPSAVTRFLLQWRPARAGCSTVAVNC